MTIISVRENSYGHPDDKAVEFYEKYSRGSNRGTKILRTDEHGHIRVSLKDGGGWTVEKNL